MEEDNKTCTQLEVHKGIHDSTVKKTLFVTSEWQPTKAVPTSFSLAVTDGCQAWTFEGSEAYVEERAEVWDKEVSWVMEKLKFYLTMGQPGVTYRFTKTQDDSRKVEYRRKCRDFDEMSVLNKAPVEQSDKYRNENFQFKKRATDKFVELLNSKKSKCRELRKENARLTELLRAKEDFEKNNSTSSLSDDDEEEIDDQPLLPEKGIERGEGSCKSLVSEDAAINEDPAATQPFVRQLEIEPQTDDPSSNAVAALVADAPYTGLQRKRRRP